YLVVFNFVLCYGIETAFFRFFHKVYNKEAVINTSAWSLVGTSLLFLVLGLSFQHQLAAFADIPVNILRYGLWILVLDALVVIPFSWLRAKERPIRYAFVKIVNVMANVGLNVFFLAYLKGWSTKFSFLEVIYIPDFKVDYIFIANLIASLITLVLMTPFYFKVNFKFDKKLWNNMMLYALPVLVAGMAYAINEASDRIMMKYLLPEDIAMDELGIYAACYKLAI